jgi:hypothetical protein
MPSRTFTVLAALRRLATAGCALGLAQPFTSGCGGGCPDPTMDNPATATWSATRSVASDAGIEVVTAVVVRWPAKPRDPFPDSYYAGATTKASSFVASIELTAPHELSIEIIDLDALVKSNPHLEVYLELPDPRDAVKCNHPGRGDSFYVRLALDFDAAAHSVSARFGATSARRGACDVGGSSSEGGGGVMFGVVLATAMLGWRRRGRVGSPSSRPET